MVTQRMVHDVPPGVGMMAPAFSSLDTSAWNDVVMNSIDGIREEVRDIMAHAATFFQLHPDEAMRLAGGYSARMGEIKIRIKEIEADYPGWRAVRTDAVEPCQEEMRWQHENHSRLHSTREFDWRVETGER